MDRTGEARRNGRAQRIRADTAPRHSAATERRDVSPKDVTRHVALPVQNILWGRAAGRCQLRPCNRPLTRSPATQETRNLAEKAHIRAFSRSGPRASHDWPDALLNDVDNLMLLCQDCHVTIDRGDGPQRYTAALLAEWKLLHEQRVETATGIAPALHSHVLTYGTWIGAHQALPTFRDASEALFPNAFPASHAMIELGTRSSPHRDSSEDFWSHERKQLAYQFERQVRIPAQQGEISHVSVFALAPQPLLIELGVHVGDIMPATTYQRHREPTGWRWPSTSETTHFVLHEADNSRGKPALVLAVSATITSDRIERVLGRDAAIWGLTVPEPQNDVVRSPATLRAFRRSVRGVLDEIKAKHGHTTPLHVFPALPVSLAVEFGRVRMPKADMPWVLYDEQQLSGGFIPTFIISHEGGYA